jgi:DNA invertase Pin-like site-specific DNA recombinase
MRELDERGIVLRSVREGCARDARGNGHVERDRQCGGRCRVLASLAELELELGREFRSAAREVRRIRGQSIGRPKVLTKGQAALARRMLDSAEPATTIAATLDASRAAELRHLAP